MAEKRTKRPPGRPSEFTPEVADEIVSRLASQSLMAICRDEAMPDRRTVERWMAADDDFAARCARAREAHIDSLVEETIEIADEPPALGPQGAIDPAAVADKKVRIAARQWYAEKVAAKKYGAKVEQTVKGDPDAPLAPPVFNISFVTPNDGGG